MTVRVWRLLAISAAAAVGLITNTSSLDVALFARAGQALVTGAFADVYSGSDNEAGPLQLVLAWMLTGPSYEIPRVIMVGLNVLVVLGTLGLRRSPAHERVDARTIAVTAYVIAWLATPVFWDGHPVEALIPAAWLAAAGAERRGRPLITAGLLAASALVAPWGVLGWPCVLRRGALRAFVRTAAAATGMCVVAYLPLLLAGRSGSLEHRWRVWPDTLVHMLAPHVQWVGWPYRIAQGLIVVAVCCAAALLLPESRHRASFVAVLAALMRIATDPCGWNYYWVPVGVVVAVLIATLPARRLPVSLTVLAGGYVAWATALAWWSNALAILAAVLVLSAYPFGPTGKPEGPDSEGETAEPAQVRRSSADSSHEEQIRHSSPT